MVGYSLAGRRRCGTFEFRCKKKPRLFKIEISQQQKTIAGAKIILKTLIWRFKAAGGGGGGGGGGGAPAPCPLNPSMKPSSADCGSFEGSSAGLMVVAHDGPVANALLFNTADGLKIPILRQSVCYK